MLSTLPDHATLARRFHALSDPTRLAILAMLERGESCVCDLQGALGAAQSRLSFHLKVLREAGLVVDRKDGRWSWYQIVPEAMHPLQDALDGFATRATPRRELPLAVLADATGCCG
jgi:ArsR family transcriptional regulator